MRGVYTYGDKFGVDGVGDAEKNNNMKERMQRPRRTWILFYARVLIRRAIFRSNQSNS